MRRAAKVDANQPPMVKLLRELGYSVQPLHAVGDGCPDLLVGIAGHNYLIEVKDGDKSPSRQALTEDQERWHGTWSGQVVVLSSECDLFEFHRSEHAKRTGRHVQP